MLHTGSISLHLDSINQFYSQEHMYLHRVQCKEIYFSYSNSYIFIRSSSSNRKCRVCKSIKCLISGFALTDAADWSQITFHLLSHSAFCVVTYVTPTTVPHSRDNLKLQKTFLILPSILNISWIIKLRLCCPNPHCPSHLTRPPVCRSIFQCSFPLMLGTSWRDKLTRQKMPT